MTTSLILIKRNIKIFFKDKGMFFTSLITPIILLVLYATFLKKVYYESFNSSLPDFIELDNSLIEGLVGGQLVSSLLSVSSVTVAFSSNFLMVQDKVNGITKDIGVSPVKSSTVSLSYYVASIIATSIVLIIAMIVSLIYLAIVGWYLSALDVLLIFVNMLMLILFGTALSSIINIFLSSQGQISAIGTIVGAGYGFISGAYMPISSFSETLQRIILFLPSIYGTSLIRNYSMRGVLKEIGNNGIPGEVIEKIKDSIDMNLYFFDNKVSIGSMYMVMIISVILLISIYILLNKKRKYNK